MTVRIPEIPNTDDLPRELLEELRPELEGAEDALAKYAGHFNKVRDIVETHQYTSCTHEHTREINRVDPNHPFGSEETVTVASGLECRACKRQMFTCAKCRDELRLVESKLSLDPDYAFVHRFECTNTECKDKMDLHHDHERGGGRICPMKKTA